MGLTHKQPRLGRYFIQKSLHDFPLARADERFQFYRFLFLTYETDTNSYIFELFCGRNNIDFTYNSSAIIFGIRDEYAAQSDMYDDCHTGGVRSPLLRTQQPLGHQLQFCKRPISEPVYGYSLFRPNSNILTPLYQRLGIFQIWCNTMWYQRLKIKKSKIKKGKI